MKKNILAAVTLMSMAALAGCGGSGGAMSNGLTPGATASIAGKVADGYLSGAVVFLDKNRNYLMDAGEPKTTTDSTGSFTLSIDPADVGKYPIVAMAVKDTTIDLDTGKPVSSSYVLSMHAVSVKATGGGVTGSVGNFISPISTQIRELMETGKYATVEQAAEELRTQLGMPADMNVQADYIKFGSYSSHDPNAPRYREIHTAARNMATLMGQQTGAVMGSGGVYVDRYRGMIGTIFSHMSSLRGPGYGTIGNDLSLRIDSIPVTPPGQSYRNMSTSFHGRMKGMPSFR